MACMTPSSSRPGTGRSRGTVAPIATTTASNRLPQVGAGEVAPHLDPGAEAGALGLHLGDPPVEDGLLHLELGDAVAQQATGWSARS